ncbi:MFS transporter [Sphaerotilus sp.]|uniref:MFS transporter n=1 Tax=Sphaerotilus sp. TaxID=2093942 RepID=UPI0034E1A6EF
MHMAAPSPLVAAGSVDGLALVTSRRALLFGNFTIGCGVMVVPGSLNDLVRSLEISVALGGQLISAGAIGMCLGAPLLAALLAGWDRRRLLALTLLWYGLGHLLCALAPTYAALLPLRALAVLGAAVFTPQAGAAMGFMAPPEQRGRSITTIFLGWSLASVLGMPLHAYIGEAFGWRWAFGLVAVLAVIGAVWVWRAMPSGVKPPVLSLRAWSEVFTHPVLMAVIVVTALSGAGQFTLFAYIAPYYRQVLSATPLEVSLLFMWFGAWGLAGNVVLSRHVDRIGAARAVGLYLSGIALSLLILPVATRPWMMALAMIPWGFGTFASNSAQQARLGHAAPLLAPALLALNTSAIYLGQAIGAMSGGALIHGTGFGSLHWAGLGWTLLALAVSRWAARRMQQDPVHV